MKFILDSKQLLDKLQYMGNVIPTTSSLPLLENILFESKNGNLQITASDLDNTLITNVDFQSESPGDFKVAISAKLLIEILKSLPHQPLTFEILQNNLITIASGTGDYSIAYHNGNEYPEPKQVETTTTKTLNSKALVKAINTTLFATGTDDLRPVMTGVLLEFKPNQLNFVSTDAHKLVKYSRKDVTSEEEAKIIVPKKPLNILKAILSSVDSDVLLEFNQTNAKFTFNRYEFLIRLIDGQYPNYEAVIPKENPNRLVINRDTFSKSLKRVSILSNKQTHQIKLSLAGTELHLSAEDNDYSNKGDERLTCEYHGTDMEIGFNSRFLVEMLSNLDCEEIELEMSQPNRAGIISVADESDLTEEILMLIMPVMLNK